MHLSRATFDGLRKAVYQHCGLVVSDDKEYLIRNRLGSVVEQRGFTGLDQLCDRLVRGRDPSLIDSVVDAVTTQETSFFRDPHVFDTLARDILPQLAIDARGGTGRVRIWSAGVSTGQEAYSLAMLVDEFMIGGRVAGSPNQAFSILGSDISNAALQTAQAGVYEARDINRGVSPARVQQFFERADGKYRVRDPARRLVEFRRVNLAETFTALGVFELICCRNVLIYFDEPTRQQICRQFHSMLTQGGRLILGSAENLYGMSSGFVSMQLGEALIYRKS
jgi:chemotaxis protein methyltransferase CheR